MIKDIPVPYAAEDVASVLRKTGGMSEDVIAKVSSEITMGVPIKELLLIQEMARSESKNGEITYENYMDCFRSVHPDLFRVSSNKQEFGSRRQLGNSYKPVEDLYSCFFQQTKVY